MTVRVRSQGTMTLIRWVSATCLREVLQALFAFVTTVATVLVTCTAKGYVIHTQPGLGWV